VSSPSGAGSISSSTDFSNSDSNESGDGSGETLPIFSTHDYGAIAATDQASYTGFAQYAVLLRNPVGTPISLSLTYVDTEDGVDIIEVFDGADRSAPLLASISGQRSSGSSLTSTSRMFKLASRIDFSIACTSFRFALFGFRAHWILAVVRLVSHQHIWCVYTYVRGHGSHGDGVLHLGCGGLWKRFSCHHQLPVSTWDVRQSKWVDHRLALHTVSARALQPNAGCKCVRWSMPFAQAILQGEHIARSRLLELRNRM
jgi:hypothetical protein